MDKKLHIGTSGWHYKHWNKTFYPERLKQSEHLAYYAEFFDAVEINNTFYRLPGESAVKAWKAKTPSHFLFTAKASRFTTHMKKLLDPKTSSDKFFAQIRHLEEKLGPILFQLPPRFKKNLERLEQFIDGIPQGYRYAFEFRERSWLSDDVYELLSQRGAALCIYDLDGFYSPEIFTAPFVYLRLHGPQGKYRGSYLDEFLKDLGKKLKKWRKERDIYCFFDNDEKAFAVENALTLREIMGSRSGHAFPKSERGEAVLHTQRN